MNKHTDPILNFRIPAGSEMQTGEDAAVAPEHALKSHTTITKTREAVDSSEHTETYD